MFGVTINGKHSLRDYELILQTVVNPLPAPKLLTVSIPGADGIIDLSDYFGITRYNNRTVTMTFAFTKGYAYRYDKQSEMARALHGKVVQFIFDEDPLYYYEGRINFDSWEVDANLGTLTFSASCNPYKLEVTSSTDPWKWDPFSFVNGVIRQTGNLSVKGSLEFNLAGSPRPVVPTFISNAPMTVSFKGKTYNIPKGTSQNYDIIVTDGDNIFTFYGTGAISILYRGGIL